MPLYLRHNHANHKFMVQACYISGGKLFMFHTSAVGTELRKYPACHEKVKTYVQRSMHLKLRLD